MKPKKPLYIIGEVGTSHQGDWSKAQELIWALKEADADCAKFQVVLAHEILHPRTGTVLLPSGEIPLYERFKALEQPREFYAKLKEETEKAGMEFLASPFGAQSAQLLQDLGVKRFKVASPELNHRPLLELLKTFQKPLILSTGVSTLMDIERAVELLHFTTEPVELSLLHCVTSYPAPPEDYNLRVLGPLSRLMGVPVGVSDHSLDPLLVPTLSVLAGAALLEKHVCLSRKDPGLDDPIALDPQDFSQMVAALKAFEELSPLDQEEWAYDRWGKPLVEGVMGNGRKTLAPSERSNYGRTNRSLHALRDLKPGDTLDWTAMAPLRTEKKLSPGMDSWIYPQVLGAVLRRAIENGEGINLEDLLTYRPGL